MNIVPLLSAFFPSRWRHDKLRTAEELSLDPASQLSDELFIHVLLFRPARELAVSMVVNKAWRARAGDDLLWQNLCQALLHGKVARPELAWMTCVKWSVGGSG
mmetsp:Transcript_155705/g.275060  ORF Transcript_155705/g.275060 Transcript_155705/m.275060 type:complete len:103 (-) Transcript_155705:234-542(-)